MDDFQKLIGGVRRAVATYDMIADGDRVAVGMSGGKDSMVLLEALAVLRKFYPHKFELCAITADMGLDGMDFSPVTELCGRLDVPYYVIHTDIARIVFDLRHEKNPCSLCAKLRRGALHGEAKERGCNKLALGHHYDDVVDTFMLNLVHGGRLSTFEPMTYLPERDITVIRPLIYVREYEIAHQAAARGLPVVKSTCPADKHTEREEMKKLLASLSRDYPDIRTRIFGAIERSHIDGWRESPRGRKK